MTDDRGIVMSAEDVANVLDLKESTVRKYAVLLKEAGYKFHTGESGRRVFFEQDVVMIQRLIALKEGGMMLKKAAEDVVKNMQAKEPEETSLSTNVDKNNSEDMQELKQILKTIVQKMDEQQRRIEAQQQYIDQRLNERDQILIETLRESAASKEEEKKKTFWKKLLGR